MVPVVSDLAQRFRVMVLRNRMRVAQYRHGTYVSADAGTSEWPTLVRIGYEPRHSPPLRGPIIVATVPKSGTHLFINAFCGAFGARRVAAFTTLPESLARVVYVGHLHRPRGADRPELNEIRRIVAVRDPRGYVASYLDHIRKGTNGEAIWREMSLRFGTDRELVSAIVKGYVASDRSQLDDIVTMYTRCALDWLGRDAMLVRYEDLVGDDKAVNRETLGRIADFLGYPEVLPSLVRGCDPLLSPTFTRAPVDRWRRVLGEAADEIVSAARNLFDELGYVP